MQIGISTEGENIVTVKNLTNINGRGEIAQFIAELELIKLELLYLFEEYQEDEE